MTHFTSIDSGGQRIGKMRLRVGQQATGIQLRATSAGDPVLGTILHQEGAGVLLDPPADYFDKATGQASRNLSMLGVEPGTTKLSALDLDRLGNATSLDELTIVVEDDPDPADLIYSGQWLYWKSNYPASMSTSSPRLFAATSGMRPTPEKDTKENLQRALYQDKKNGGPIPEGVFELDVSIDSAQATVEQANRLGPKALDRVSPGIQFLPVGPNGPNSDWGSMRARLEPKKGDMHNRNGFYVHNSHKAFSHGCIEVGVTQTGQNFFTLLLAYAHDPKRKRVLTLRVRYDSPDQSTLGTTYRPPALKRP